MKDTFLITEENLIGSIATAMLQLKKIKRENKPTTGISSIIELIDFINRAHGNDYEELLYEKNFLVSKHVLNNLHEGLGKNEIASKIDLQILMGMLSKMSTQIKAEEIDFVTDKLKNIIEILLRIKTGKQIYM